MGEDTEDSVTFALAVAQAVLCSSHTDLDAPVAQHCIYKCARAQGSHAAVPVGAVCTQHSLGQE